MEAFRRTASTFLGVLLAASVLAACGQAEGGDPKPHTAQRTLGIPVLKGVKSGELEVTLSSHGGSQRNSFYMRLLGTFLGAASGALPQVDFGAEASGAWRGNSVDFNTALIATNDRAVLTYNGETYETDRPTFEALQESFGETVGSGSSADLAACLEATGEIIPGHVAGTSTPPTHTTALGETDVKTVKVHLKIDSLVSALRQVQSDPACGAQVRVAGPFPGLLGAVEAELKRASRVEASLSLDRDGILRELSVHVTLPSTGEVEFLVRLTSVNEVAELPPCHGERALVALFEKLGFSPLRPIERGEAEGLIGLLKGIFQRSGEASRA